MVKSVWYSSKRVASISSWDFQCLWWTRAWTSSDSRGTRTGRRVLLCDGTVGTCPSVRASPVVPVDCAPTRMKKHSSLSRCSFRCLFRWLSSGRSRRHCCKKNLTSFVCSAVCSLSRFDTEGDTGLCFLYCRRARQSQNRRQREEFYTACYRWLHVA